MTATRQERKLLKNSAQLSLMGADLLAQAMCALETAIEEREYTRWTADDDEEVEDAKVDEARKRLVLAVQAIANQAVADAA